MNDEKERQAYEDDKLVPELRAAFYYDSQKRVYVRSNNIFSDTNTNKHEEFSWIMCQQFGEWNPYEWIVKGHSEGKLELCVCTHSIKMLCYITHKSSGMTFQVGSKCCEKVCPTVLKSVQLFKKKSDNREKGYICHYCYEPMVDRRNKFKKENFCNISCKRKYEFPIPFGK
jgi:hypothetical protein